MAAIVILFPFNIIADEATAATRDEGREEQQEAAKNLGDVFQQARWCLADDKV